MDRQGGSVAAFDHLYLPRIHRRGFVAPDVGRDIELIGSPGGHVLDSTPGLYRDVLSFDFRSLYPSIIRTFLIDPLGLAQRANVAPSSPFTGSLPGDRHRIRDDDSRTRACRPPHLAARSRPLRGEAARSCVRRGAPLSRDFVREARWCTKKPLLMAPPIIDLTEASVRDPKRAPIGRFTCQGVLSSSSSTSADASSTSARGAPTRFDSIKEVLASH